VFNLASGAALLAASVIAGALWEWLGPAYTYGAGALFASMALTMLLVKRRP
jgi:hypothetical protein